MLNSNHKKLTDISKMAQLKVLCCVSSLRNNNLAATHGPKCLCGRFGIQVGDCETTLDPKKKEGCFEKAGPCQVADSLTMIQLQI